VGGGENKHFSSAENSRGGGGGEKILPLVTLFTNTDLDFIKVGVIFFLIRNTTQQSCAEGD